ncbi:acetyltransferase [Colletotrichum musicola]|uniref:Acetyltransferase n=1 Tax=Colletotrichum musicola TaxID=2175873 RepID=A0A8H6NSP3_9PEZI|nr:acetyltransferase [Colletotrichum musicola]
MQASHLQPQEDGPLCRLSFDLDTSKNEEQREEIIAWYIEGLKQAIDREKGHFRQIRNSEGRPIAFCGWTLDGQHPENDMRHTRGDKRPEVPCLQALNLEAWCQLSNSLRTERKRVLQNLDRRGLGSRLLRWFCEETDKNGRFAYILASPEGVHLYRRFDFEIFGVVFTSEGDISSMLRQLHGILKAIEALVIDAAKDF